MSQLGKAQHHQPSDSEYSDNKHNPQKAFRTPKKKRTKTLQAPPTPKPANPTTEEEDDETYTILELIKDSKTLIAEIRSKDFPDTAKPLLRKHRNNLATIESLHIEEHTDLIKLAAVNHEIKKKNEDCKTLLLRLTDKIPTEENIAILMKRTIETKTEELKTLLAASLKDEVLALTAGIPQTTNTAASTEEHLAPGPSSRTPSIHTPMQVQHHPPSPTDLAKRTLIIKGRKQQPGQSIMELLGEIHFQVGVVHNVYVNRYSVEITFATKTLKDQTKHELQNNKAFKTTHDLLDKQVNKEQLILIGIPDHLDNDYITNSIAHTYNIPAEDILIQRTFANRRGGKNCAFLVPEDDAFHLLHSGGVMLGPRFTPVRPFITVQRCRRCQHLGHTDKRCKKLPFCDNCGEAHESATACTNRSRCVNCEDHNRNSRDRYTTNHKASDSNCPSYQDRVQEQKEKTYAYYDLPPPQRQPNRQLNFDRPPPLPERPPLLPDPPRIFNQQPGQDFPFPHPAIRTDYHPTPYDYPAL